MAAPLSYANDSPYLPDSHFLRLPDFVTMFGLPRRNVNPAPPDQPTCLWLRAGAIRLSHREDGVKDSIPLGIFAFFNGDISIDHVIELIKTHKTTDKDTLRRMRGHFRGHSSVLVIPRMAHCKQTILEKAAAAKRSLPHQPLRSPQFRRDFLLISLLLLPPKLIPLPLQELRLLNAAPQILILRRTFRLRPAHHLLAVLGVLLPPEQSPPINRLSMTSAPLSPPLVDTPNIHLSDLIHINVVLHHPPVRAKVKAKALTLILLMPTLPAKGRKVTKVKKVKKGLKAPKDRKVILQPRCCKGQRYS